MARGVIKWFDDAKGFGFIASDDGGADLFVEHTELGCSNDCAFRDGQEVEFDVGLSPRGRHARRVHRR